jgi:hypothetical protein
LFDGTQKLILLLLLKVFSQRGREEGREEGGGESDG